ncbi:hypothetical protein PTSG_12238 [Salpingoeca rosetta]|uniref:Anaphase-promoting complex subunit 1 N-terminal domain-containing protein n=1 Tax=Salpingoeca rosetta (strain ATCC 50818 / BSB-021) TaxID=946362 RepID=F2U976_SALR5|nr:uncharacterized protein PTSG_12238 [Salpingoeca rosetta]EGD73279.1 hypothetical protein PTSG_12238 [Salpingoeca rosetta]|eukprot:XP_004994310.1 hypothetical protein PTSG_12238 [Salpingoeca rosetta]
MRLVGRRVHAGVQHQQQQAGLSQQQQQQQVHEGDVFEVQDDDHPSFGFSLTGASHSKEWSLVTDDSGSGREASTRCTRFAFSSSTASVAACGGMETRVLVKGCSVVVERFQASTCDGARTATTQDAGHSQSPEAVQFRSYTLETEPIDVLWATFPTDPNSSENGGSDGDSGTDDAPANTTLFTDPTSTAPAKRQSRAWLVECLCVVELSHILVVAATGDVFTVRLPFAVQSVHAFSTGLLITRKPLLGMSEADLSFSTLQAHDDSLVSDDGRPVLYTLSHPLEELRPLLIRDCLSAVRRRASPDNNEVELAYRGGIRPLAIFTLDSGDTDHVAADDTAHQTEDVLMVYDAVAGCVRMASLQQRDDTHRFQQLLAAAVTSAEPRIRIRTPYNARSASAISLGANTSTMSARAPLPPAPAAAPAATTRGSGQRGRRSLPHNMAGLATASTPLNSSNTANDNTATATISNSNSNISASGMVPPFSQPRPHHRHAPPQLPSHHLHHHNASFERSFLSTIMPPATTTAATATAAANTSTDTPVRRRSTTFVLTTPTSEGYRRAASATPTTWQQHHSQQQLHSTPGDAGSASRGYRLSRSLTATPTPARIGHAAVLATPRTAAAINSGMSPMDLDKLYPRHTLELQCCVMTHTPLPHGVPSNVFLTGQPGHGMCATLCYDQSSHVTMLSVLPPCMQRDAGANGGVRGVHIPRELAGRWICASAPNGGASPPTCTTPSTAVAAQQQDERRAKGKAGGEELKSSGADQGAGDNTAQKMGKSHHGARVLNARAAFPISFVSPPPPPSAATARRAVQGDVLVHTLDGGLDVYVDRKRVGALALCTGDNSQGPLRVASISHVTTSRFSATTPTGETYRFSGAFETLDERSQHMVRSMHTLCTLGTAAQHGQSGGGDVDGVDGVSDELLPLVRVFAGTFPEFVQLLLAERNASGWTAVCDALLLFVGHAPAIEEVGDGGEEEEEEIVLPVDPSTAAAAATATATHSRHGDDEEEEEEEEKQKHGWDDDGGATMDWDAALAGLSFADVMMSDGKTAAVDVASASPAARQRVRKLVPICVERAIGVMHVLHSLFLESQLSSSTQHAAVHYGTILIRLAASIGWRHAMAFYALRCPALMPELRSAQREFSAFVNQAPRTASFAHPAGFSPRRLFCALEWSSSLLPEDTSPSPPMSVFASITPRLHAVLAALSKLQRTHAPVVAEGKTATVGHDSGSRDGHRGVDDGDGGDDGQEATTVAMGRKRAAFVRRAQAVIETLARHGVTEDILLDLQPGLRFPLQLCLQACVTQPPELWSPEAYNLVQRDDLALQNKRMPCLEEDTEHASLPALAAMYPRDAEVAGGSVKSSKLQPNTLLSDLRFPCDRRVQEACRLLDSSVVCTVHMTQEMGTSDHDFLVEQKRRLLFLSNRTFALAVGRGMLTLASLRPIPTQAIEILPLVLSGQFPAQKTTLAPDFSEVESTHMHWPHFHNGVAAGLQLAPPPLVHVGASWIPHHEVACASSMEEYAGFLFGLGLQGHLPSLSNHDVSKYLNDGHELVCIALLLGMAAARPGTMDTRTSKMLAIHLEDFLPPTSHGEEVTAKITINTQTAALVGMGLLYRGTCHRRIAEVMLAVMGRPPCVGLAGPLDRESFALGAGFALGLIVLGKGGHAIGLEDLALEDVLYHYIKGARKRSPDTSQTGERVLENDMINTHVTAPAAVVALGLMYMKTNNEAVAARLALPDTQFLLDTVRPDVLLLLVMSRSLILWDDIEPTREWIDSQCPPVVQRYAIENRDVHRVDEDVLETARQAQVFILAGACLALGLRFAGTAHQGAVDAIMSVVELYRKKIPPLEARRINPINVATCLHTALLAASMVMAGTGYIPVLRIIRALRTESAVKTSYGHHMAMHMAAGLLFLGGGTMTLSRSNEAIAALLMAFFPKFPLHTADNQYHLQALRHLHAMAAVPRMLAAKEVGSKALVHVPVVVKIAHDADDDGDDGSSANPSRRGVGAKANDAGGGSGGVSTLHLVTPCLLPTSLDRIISIETVGHRYFQNTIRPMTNGLQRRVLMRHMTLHVKLRPGRVPYRANTLLVEDLVRQCERALGVTTPKTIRPVTTSGDFSAILSSEQHATSEITDQELAVVHTREAASARNDVTATFLPQAHDPPLPLHVACFGRPDCSEPFINLIAAEQQHAIGVPATLAFLHRTSLAAGEWLTSGCCSAAVADDFEQLSAVLAHTQEMAALTAVTGASDGGGGVLSLSPQIQGMLVAVRDDICTRLARRICSASRGDGGVWKQLPSAVRTCVFGDDLEVDELSALDAAVLNAARAVLALLSLRHGSLRHLDRIALQSLKPRIDTQAPKTDDSSGGLGGVDGADVDVETLVLLADAHPSASIAQLQTLAAILVL